jgi:hypothetical protein
MGQPVNWVQDSRGYYGWTVVDQYGGEGGDGIAHESSFAAAEPEYLAGLAGWLRAWVAPKGEHGGLPKRLWLLRWAGFAHETGPEVPGRLARHSGHLDGQAGWSGVRPDSFPRCLVWFFSLHFDTAWARVFIPPFTL